VVEVIAERAKSAGLKRPIQLLLQNEENQASLARTPKGSPVHFTAQWNDDSHHVLHAAATGETAGYYIDYDGDAEKLSRALAEGFAFHGDVMRYPSSPPGGGECSSNPYGFRCVYSKP
jgi:maltooligosyltrehalose trehalohydrolase